MKYIVLVMLGMCFSFSNAQTAQTLFDNANQLYQQEDYQKSIKQYQSILDAGKQSSDLYYNLGNAYYKTNQIAAAIYNYEKALQLNPNHLDAKNNLAYANRSLIDSIKVVPKSVFQKFNHAVLAKLSYNTWAILAVSCSLLAGLLWMLFFFSTNPGVKKMYFTLGVLISIGCFLTLCVASQQYVYHQNTVFAIVFDKQVSVKNAPRNTALEIFKLHEGTKLQIIDKVGSWHKIKIADGQEGWLPKASIQPF